MIRLVSMLAYFRGKDNDCRGRAQLSSQLGLETGGGRSCKIWALGLDAHICECCFILEEKNHYDFELYSLTQLIIST